MLNQFLTNIYMFKNNLYNLHFNVKGEGSSSLHKELTNDINEVNLMYDNLYFYYIISCMCLVS